jgi:hypothetical protein
MRKLQGKGAVGAYCDEAPTYPKDVLGDARNPHSSGRYQDHSHDEPDSPMHYIKKGYQDRLDDVNGRSWHFTLDDNRSCREKVKGELKKQYTGLWYKRYILGLWVDGRGRCIRHVQRIYSGHPRSAKPMVQARCGRRFWHLISDLFRVVGLVQTAHMPESGSSGRNTIMMPQKAAKRQTTRYQKTWLHS